MSIAIILGIIAAAISVASTATTQGMSARARKKDYLWTILRTPVYEQGLSLESVKLMYLSEYRANPDLFKRYYDEYISIRNADIATGTHPLSKKKSILLYKKYIIIGLLILVMVIIYEQSE